MSAKNYRNKAKDALRGRWGVAVGTKFVAFLLGASSLMGNYNGGGLGYLTDLTERKIIAPLNVLATWIILLYIMVWWFITFNIGGAVKLGYIRFNKNLILNQSPQFKDLFSRFNMFGKALLLRLLTLFYIIAWTLLFIIPGIIASYRYMMAPYILEENPNMSVSDTLRFSKQMMKGNKWRLFCLQISFIGWGLLVICTCGIALLWVQPYYYASEAAFFFKVSARLKAKQQGSQNQYQNQYQNPTSFRL